MSNRYFQQIQYSLERAVTSVFARVSFGAAGAPTLIANRSKGVYSVSRNSAGLYTVTFGLNAQALDKYNFYLGTELSWLQPTSQVPDAPHFFVQNDLTATSSTLQIQFFSPSGEARDPASGDVASLEFKFKNTSIIY